MPIPANLSRFTSRLVEKLKDFGDRITFSAVLSWIQQFDEPDQPIAAQIFLKLQYFSDDEVRRLCRTLHGRYFAGTDRSIEDVLFVGLGAAGDSGGMLSYMYRTSNNLPESQFVNADQLLTGAIPRMPHQVVFLDDFIGTGAQAAELLTGEIGQLQRHLNVTAAFLALVGFDDGIERVRRSTGIDVFVAHLLTERDRVFSEASTALTEDYFERQRYRQIVQGYGNRLYPRGPLGYGGSEALVAFFHNTPNNTLPVIWADTPHWTPLLRRAEAKAPESSAESGTLILTYLHLNGGRCLLEDLDGLGTRMGAALQALLVSLRDKRTIEIEADDEYEFIALTPKGQRKCVTFLEGADVAVRDSILACAMHLLQLLPASPRTTHEHLAEVRRRRQALVHTMEYACTQRLAEPACALRNLTSWLLQMDGHYGERIRLGTLFVDAFSEADVGSAWGFAQIDDLGWSSIVLGRLEQAAAHIQDGLACLWRRDDFYGVCQAWRHLQGLKSRLGRLAEAEIGLRLVFGAACAIEDAAARLDMQAGIVRGLINVARARDDKTAVERYTRLADQLRLREYEGLHAPARRFAPAIAMPAFDSTAMLLVRHPMTIKNLRLMFGRQAAATIPETERDHVETLADRLADSLHAGAVGPARLCCSPAKAPQVLASALANRTGKTVSTCPDLDSIDSGDLTGLTEADAAEHFPDIMRILLEYRSNRRDGYDVRLPGGESVRHLTMRVARFLVEDLFSGEPPHTAILIAHTSSITALLNILTSLDRMPPDSSYRYYEVPVASVRKVVLSYSECRVSVDHAE